MFKKIKATIECIHRILAHVFKIEAYMHSIKNRLNSVQSDIAVLQNAIMIKEDVKKEVEEENDDFKSFKETMISFIDKNAIILEGSQVKGLGIIKSFGIVSTHAFDEVVQDYVVTYKKYVAINNINELGVKIINITDETEIKHC